MEEIEANRVRRDGTIDGNVEPPLGIRPKEVIIKDRIKEIVSAMRRYQTSRKKIPSEWFEELEQLIFNE